ncbi:MAG: hypothetical protein IPL59_22680 [Candidatus Competibacteraceae bacterium]|nr:hypothetical protein [Candidatus Competibacteraceae bacterium]
MTDDHCHCALPDGGAEGEETKFGAAHPRHPAGPEQTPDRGATGGGGGGAVD